ncbi:DNA-directed RNA polymerase sigma-70 factor [Streptomyces sp. SID10853]|uniref:DNA-directed RNA polymerase sigma-70 factor n=1 Tax=Streptomyces sp. SID10853 TaxID=2706028 RepID=UPI0013C01552|nr:DNA-directed RNA polymerase sigma-70 factor [Streptomyces sp. SID10853]NDZ80315.1 DNA-directed RNA polymerase sigma-70 factor [Streptomyces sp. SID10853]
MTELRSPKKRRRPRKAKSPGTGQPAEDQRKAALPEAALPETAPAETALAESEAALAAAALSETTATLELDPRQAQVAVDADVAANTAEAGEPGDTPAPQPPGAAAPQATPDDPEQPPDDPGLTPAEAFDLLYARAASGLVHQTYLLTGRHHLARESVERAFHLAWQSWPEVATDRDPAGWVRAAAYEYAMSPWRGKSRKSHKRGLPDRETADAAQVPLRDAVLRLPPAYRRTLLLYDGLGLDLPDTAAETEASTPAAANRLLYARSAVARALPDLEEPALLQEQLAALTRTGPGAALPEPRSVRTRSERRTRFWTRLTIGCVALLAALTVFTLVTAPTHYSRPTGPPHRVEGVPPRGGPQRLTAEDKKLHQKLRAVPANGPERLVPQLG